MRVLVDSSVWINYFRDGEPEILSQLLVEDLVCTNDLILTELIPSLKFQNKQEVLEGLYALPKLQLEIDWEIIRRYQLHNMQHGVNKVGIPDLIILQQVIFSGVVLFSLDKHFRLMSNFYEYKMFEY